MTLCSAEVYTVDGKALNAASTVRLTPERILKRSLETRLPSIFHVEAQDAVKQDSTKQDTVKCVGLTLPIIAAGKLHACASLLWQARDDFASVLEIWRPAASGVLRLGDSFYGAQQDFERTSRTMSFQVLEGLPGFTFDAHKPVIFETLSRMRGFVRAEAAAAAGLRVGLGIPVLDKGTASCAVLLLSSERTPLARTFEVWLPDRLGPRLASSRTLTPEAESSRPPCPALAEAVIGSRMPQLEHSDSGLNVGLPIFGGKNVASVVVLRG